MGPNKLIQLLGKPIEQQNTFFIPRLYKKKTLETYVNIETFITILKIQIHAFDK